MSDIHAIRKELLNMESEICKDYQGIYNKPREIKKIIKEKIAAKGALLKSSAVAQGAALDEIVSVMDDELMTGMQETLLKAQGALSAYCKKYNDVERLVNLYCEMEEKLEKQNAAARLVSGITDEPLRNAILAFNAMKDKETVQAARDVAITYLTSIGRQDLTKALDAQVKND